MRHETALKCLDRLDAGQSHGLALRLHLSRCDSCAAAAQKLALALAAYRESPADREDPLPDAGLFEDRVMAAVRLTPPPRQDFALGDWLLPAAIIALSMFFLPIVGKDSGFLQSLFGSGYELSLALVLGIGFTAYSALFIATHLSELQSFLEKRGLLQR
jgi:hypothetical protein